jgi:hypothetical protein
MLEAVLTRGHRIASGLAGDPRFPKGTLALQLPLFKARGLDLLALGFHPATLNLSIAPLTWEPRRPKLTLRGVHWTDRFPPEDFSFFDCRLAPAVGPASVQGLVYYPHPETKPDHFQDPTIIEVFAPKFETISYGETLGIELPPDQISIRDQC